MPESSHPEQSSRTIYSVSSGEYSDYGISVLFESREDAEAFIAEASRESYVEEFELFSAGTRPQRVELFWVQVDSSGTEIERRTYDRWPIGGPGKLEYSARAYVGADRNGAAAASVRSFDAALQAARDFLTARQLRDAGL